MEEEKKKSGNLSVRTICYAAAFVALSVLTNVFELSFGVNASNKLGFNYTVCFLSGVTLGPLVGFIVGVCGDVLGWLINPVGGSFNPAVTVVTGLIGTISGFIFLLWKKTGKEDKNILPTVVSFLLIFLVCTNLNTVAIYFYYMSGKYAFWAYYAIRIPKQLISWSINFALSLILTKYIRAMVKVNNR